jgi:hypothetical protein
MVAPPEVAAAGAPVALRALLKRVVAAQGWQERLEHERALSVWPSVAGLEIARHTLAVGVRAGVLHVAVRSGAWAAQLAFFRSELLRRLQAEGAHIRDIHFRVGLPDEPRVEGAQCIETADQAESPSAAEVAAAHELEAEAGALGPELARLYLAATARRRRLGGA